MMTRSFIQISDSHIDNDKFVMGVDSQKNLSAVVSNISKNYFDALIITVSYTHLRAHET